MLELIPLLLGVAAVVLLVYAMITRKNWLETKALLADTTIRYKAALSQSQKAEQNQKAQKELLERFRQQTQKAEKQAEDIKNRASDGKLEIIRMKTEFDGQLQKLDSQREHLLEQVQVLTTQLSETVREKKAQGEELSTLQRSLDDRARSLSEGLRTQLAETQIDLKNARNELKNAERAFDKLQKEAGLVKPEELRRWHAKVARLEQLYASMKGLREMAEERNQNWETALRYFAQHILGTQSTEASDSIGALVGAALEKIGATLVDDDAQEVPYTHSGASPSAGVESHA